jgi:hypothetical protein
LIDQIESDPEDEEFDDEIEEEDYKNEEENKQEEENGEEEAVSIYNTTIITYCIFIMSHSRFSFFIVLYLSGCCDGNNSGFSSCL